MRLTKDERRLLHEIVNSYILDTDLTDHPSIQEATKRDKVIFQSLKEKVDKDYYHKAKVSK